MRSFLRSQWAIIAATFALAAIATTAHAQTFTNPPCTSVLVTNNGPCQVTATFITIPAGAWPTLIIPVGSTMPLPVPTSGITVTGVVDINGVFFPTTPPPPPAGSPCGPTNWWTPPIPMGPGCNVQYCLDPMTCAITIW